MSEEPKATNRSITAAIQARLQRSQEIEKIEDLPLWVKQALTRKHLEDLDYGEVAKQFRRKRQTLEAYSKSPAAKEWTAGLKSLGNDPREFVRAHLTASTTNIVSDFFYALELAKGAGDHNAIRLMTQYLMERPEMLGAAQKEAPAQIIINLGGGASLEPQMIQSSHAEVKVEGEVVEGSWEEGA